MWLQDSHYRLGSEKLWRLFVILKSYKKWIDFVVRVHLPNGSVKEYRHHVFKDVLTEMVIDLQEELSE